MFRFTPEAPAALRAEALWPPPSFCAVPFYTVTKRQNPAPTRENRTVLEGPSFVISAGVPGRNAVQRQSHSTLILFKQIDHTSPARSTFGVAPRLGTGLALGTRGTCCADLKPCQILDVSPDIQGIPVSRFPPGVDRRLHVKYRHVDADSRPRLAHLPLDSLLIAART